MPDPSLSPLPPEWVEAIYGVVRDAFGVAWTNARADAICAALEPLLAERDAELRRLREAGPLVVADADRWFAEARRLREAAERALTNVRDGAPGIAASILSAALSASPVPEKGAEYNGRDITPAPASVSVPEQEEGRARTSMAAEAERASRMVASWPRGMQRAAAASSSSSEEGERARRDYSFDDAEIDAGVLRAGITAACAEANDLVRLVSDLPRLAREHEQRLRLAPSLRERLTSDEAVEAFQGRVCRVIANEDVRRRLGRVADYLDNRTEGAAR